MKIIGFFNILRYLNNLSKFLINIENTYFKPYFKSATPCNSKEKCWRGGKYPKNIKRNNLNNLVLDRPCNKGIASPSLGDACTVALSKNNWKFPKGYPW